MNALIKDVVFALDGISLLHSVSQLILHILILIGNLMQDPLLTLHGGHGFHCIHEVHSLVEEAALRFNVHELANVELL